MTEIDRIIKSGLIDEKFLEPEVRCDFVVDKTRKKLWAVELDILCEIERICKKYKLKYYAFAGTLLGAIRHSGFIPWDDDIDLAMYRKDYEIFCKVAPYELPPYLFLQSAYTEMDYGAPHIKIRNSRTTGATKYDFGFEYNKGIFIDIFPLDNIPDDDCEYREMCKKISVPKRILDIAVRKFYYIGDEIVSDSEKEQAYECVKKYGVHRVYSNMEELCNMYNMQKTKRCSWLLFHLDDGCYYNNEDYTDCEYVPFENISMPVPKGYDGILSAKYGDYMKPVKGGESHGELIVSVNTPYCDYEI